MTLIVEPSSTGPETARQDRRVGDLHQPVPAVVDVDDDRVERRTDQRCEDGRLDGVGGGPLQLAGEPVRLGHDRRDRRQCVAGPARHVGPPAQRLADDQAEPVDQPAQRGRDMRVGRGDRGVLGLLRHVTDERRVARAAEERRRLVHDGQLARFAAVEGAQERAVRQLGRPASAEGGRLPMEPREGEAIRARHGAQDADLAAEHDVGRDHPGEQRDLGVPVLHGERRPELQPVAAVLDQHLLLRDGQARPAAGLLQAQPELADLAEQLEARVAGPTVDSGLDVGVVEPVHALDQGQLARRPRRPRRPGRA